MSDPSRIVAAALEPVAGQVYFAPEAHAAYAALGFEPSPGAFPGFAGSPRSAAAIAFPDSSAYFTSRGSVMGQVSGEVVAAAFGVFNPQVVAAGVEFGWSLTDAQSICAARDSGAIGQLVRVLGDTPERLDEARELLERANAPLRPAGKPLYSGLLSLGMPGHPVGDVWRLADMLREYRGDAHTAAWTSAGFDAPEIGLLTELYWGLPPRTYVRTRAWSDAQLDEAQERLTSRGLIKAGGLTEKGRAEREAVEQTTDRQCRPVVDALGENLTTLVAILEPWGAAIRDSSGYPRTSIHRSAE